MKLRRAGVVLVVAAIAASATGPARAQAPGCVGFPVAPGVDIQALVDTFPEGTAFCLAPGVHRIVQPIRPKTGNSFVGVSGAVLNGAVVLEPEPDESGRYVAPAALHKDPAKVVCATETPLCWLVHRVWIGDEKLQPVASEAAVGPGTYFADFENDRIVLGEDPAGRPVEMSTARLAITGQVGPAITDEVTVEGLIVERFANQRRGAIAAFGGSDWTIANNEVRDNHGCGIGAGPGATVTANHVHHNGQIGMCGQGAGVEIVDNEISHNNTDGFDARWEGGGSKWVNTTDLIVRDNRVHHNEGPGLWTDWNNTGTLYEGNIVRRNSGEGIFHEASYRGVIRDNFVRGNDLPRHGPWGAGIMVSSSGGVKVTGNTVAYNTNGIALVHATRGTADLGPLVLKKVVVRNNVIVMNEGYSGFWSRVAGYSREGSLRFARNRYHLLNGRKHFMWRDEMGLNLKAWKKVESGAAFRFKAPAQLKP